MDGFNQESPAPERLGSLVQALIDSLIAIVLLLIILA